MIGARDRALAFLSKQVEWVATFRRQLSEGGSAELEGRIDGCLEVLEFAGVLSPAEAAQWREWIAAGGVPRPEAPDELRQAGEALLGELLDAVPRDDDDDLGSELTRFEGALGALSAIGAISGTDWDERLSTHMNWPTAEEEREQLRELNAGGTQQELLAVHPGPGFSPDGMRVLYVLAFADGLSVHVHSDDGLGFDDEDDGWWVTELADDLGTQYEFGGGSGGSDRELHIGFRTPIPEAASWLEVRGLSQDPIRVELR